ncbi:MAG: 3-phosphoshikimate 1-carboxyvinyltransferase [Candidatus Omnitrophota bacterium]|nr:MAG: 3-phosphoshikimate 1-carboxyvinyltransferase [Candidatus Omnitrophota bacterium]
MTDVKVCKIPAIRKEIILPGDKSISHRAVIIASIAKGPTLIRNFLASDDCLHTMSAFEKMGVEIQRLASNQFLINGTGLYGLSKPDSEIYLGNSGTSMRLLLGIFAGQEFEALLTGDESLCKRPMKRVTHPLRMMGTNVEGADDANFAPLKIKGIRPLRAINYTLPIPSAQVKSCIMLASLYAGGTSHITEPQQSRDHTERMFKLFNAKVSVNGGISVTGGSLLISPGELTIPSDISSAAFFIALALLLPESEIIIKSCGINPTRRGFIDTLKKMGADIDIVNIKGEDLEPYADIIVRSSKLKSIIVEADQIPKMIDEIPALALTAAFASGKTVIKGVGELRVKETDRINSMLTNLRLMDVDITAQGDTIIVKGPSRLKAGKLKSFGDHRTAMTMVIAGCLADGETTVEDIDCISTSFPGFMELIKLLQARR